MSVWADEVKTCEYCHEAVSIYESLTEYGKHWHERCYIHKANKEIDGYKKKWINGKLTKGDKADLVDKFNLVQKLTSETTTFHGFVPVREVERHTPLRKERRILTLPGNVPVLGSDGKPIFVEELIPSVSCRYLWMRPKVTKQKNHIRRRLVNSAEEILQIEGGN